MSDVDSSTLNLCMKCSASQPELRTGQQSADEASIAETVSKLGNVLRLSANVPKGQEQNLPKNLPPVAATDKPSPDAGNNGQSEQQPQQSGDGGREVTNEPP